MVNTNTGGFAIGDVVTAAGWNGATAIIRDIQALDAVMYAIFDGGRFCRLGKLRKVAREALVKMGRIEG